MACLLVYGSVLWIWGVGRTDIAHSREAERAVGARIMLRSGDYLIPRAADRVNLAKPPLFYWCVALAARLAGGAVTETTVRLPSALSAMALLILLYFAVRPTFGALTAYLSCVVAATLPMVFGAATDGDVNMLLALCVACSLLTAFYMLESPGRGWGYAVLCGASLAVGLLTKGPIVLLFFIPTVLLYLGYAHADRLSRDWRWSLGYMAAAAILLRLSLSAAVLAGPRGAPLYLAPTGMLLYFGLRGANTGRGGLRWLIVLATALVLAAPWPVLAAVRLGYEQLRDALVREAWQLRSSDVGPSNSGPIWYYIAAVPAGALPYSLLLGLAFVPGRADVSPHQRGMLLLARCWLAGSLVLFTMVTPARTLRYLLPVVPAISILTADVLARGTVHQLRPWMNLYVRCWSVACVYALTLGPLAVAELWFRAHLAWSGWTTATVAVAGTGGILGFCLMHLWKNRWAPLVSVALALVSVKMWMHFGNPDVANREKSPRPACRQLRARVPQGEELYLYGDVPPEAVFYLDAETFALRTLDSVGHAFICTVPGAKGAVDVPPGTSGAALKRVSYGKQELVLLRVEKSGNRVKAN